MSQNGILVLQDAADPVIVGGKAANLGRLTRAGYRVPKGFVIPAGSDVSELKEDILAQFDTHGLSKVAVRSSALNEDGANDSWAGQLDTFLNVGRDQLLDRILACQASANSARAKSYGQQNRAANDLVSVIVQEMVQSEVSGVSFSVNPVTGDQKQAIIEAASGLGEAVVSGEVTPDTFILDKATGHVIEERVVNAPPSLSAARLAMVLEMTLRLETDFSCPVDIEWAFAGYLYALQCRPITTL